MNLMNKLKQIFSETETDPEKIRQEKKEQINNLTENNDFMNDQVQKLFDILDD